MTTLYEYATNVKNVLLTMGEFQSDDSGANVGIGFKGWQDSWAYSRANDLDQFAVIMFPGAEHNASDSFAKHRLAWKLMIFVYRRFTVEDGIDQDYTDLANSVVSTLSNTSNRLAIDSKGTYRVLSVLPMDQSAEIEGVTYIPIVIDSQILEDY